MRKLLLIIMTLLLPQIVSAQSVEAKVKKIREQYSYAQEIAKWKNTDEWMEHGCHTLEFKSRANYAGGGVVLTNTEVFLDISDDYERADFNTARPLLTRETSERSSKVYREMLFDPDTGALLFCYQRGLDTDGNTIEWRFYYDNGKLIKSVPAKTGESMYMSSAEYILGAAEAMRLMILNFNSIY